jgi:branched-chain amino acid aminotransferase
MLLINGSIADDNNFTEDIFRNGYSIYEVVRVFKNKPLFLNDNNLRLLNSIKNSNTLIDVSKVHFTEYIEKYISLSNMKLGNIKYILYLSEGVVNEYVYEIASSYPSEKDYREGVEVATLEAERETPQVKYLDPRLRELTNEIIHARHLYEVILVNKKGIITEGSRSNIFFIKGNTLFTAPSDMVLSGTSRKRVIDICINEGIQLIEQAVAYKNLRDFDAVFISGTSPLVLPVHYVDNMEFNVNNTLLREIMDKYFSLL